MCKCDTDKRTSFCGKPGCEWPEQDQAAPEPRVHFDLTVDQAAAVDLALDAYTRLCIGQIEEVASLVRQGVIPLAREGREDRATASCAVADEVDALMNQAKALLGYPSNGSNGIGHQHVHISGRRAYEAHKVLASVPICSRVWAFRKLLTVRPDTGSTWEPATRVRTVPSASRTMTSPADGDRRNERCTRVRQCYGLTVALSTHCAGPVREYRAPNP